MSEELKPCPFCNCAPTTRSFFVSDGTRADIIECSSLDCWAEPSVCIYEDHGQAVAEIWNSRPVEDELRAEVSAQRELLADWMMGRGMSTGHGDTTAALLSELDSQWRELRAEITELKEEICHLHQVAWEGKE